MSNIDNIPSRIKYYLLDYKDRNMLEFLKLHGEKRLRDLSASQIKAYFIFATAKDVKLLSKT